MLKVVRSILLLTLAVLTVSVFAADPIEITYAPVDGEAFVTNSTVTRTSTLGDQGAKTDVSETEARVVVHEAEGGYANSVTVLSTKFEREGHPIASPLFAAMVDLELTYNLDADGKLKEISGYEGLVDALEAKFPPAISQTMAPLLNYHSIRLRDEADYRERYEGFIGAKFTPGTTMASAKAQALPYGGTLLVYVVTEVGELTDCGSKRCLGLHQTYDSDAEALAAAFDTYDDEALKAAAGDINAELSKNHVRASVEGSGTIVLEPDTLFLVSRKSSHDIELLIDQPSKDPLAVSMKEVRSFSSEREPKAAGE